MIDLLVIGLLQVAAGDPAPPEAGAAPATEAADAAAETAPAAPAEPARRMVEHCHTEMPIGSHQSVRVCRTEQQRNADRRDAADLMRHAASLPMRAQDINPGGHD
jgi:hypothetical protein